MRETVGYLSVMDILRRDPRPFRIGLLPVPGFALMSYSATVEPLRAANLLTGETLYEIVHFGPEAGATVQSSGSAAITAAFGVGDTPPLDLLLVLAGGDPTRFRDRRTLAWLKRLARGGTALGGVSGGPVILARAGLMDGRRLTVHWEHAPYLEETYPELALDRRLYVIDRDRVTCGGGTAPLELMHALVSAHYGSDVARGVSDWFLHTDIRAPAAPQRSGLVERLGTNSPRLVAAVQAMEDHVADPLTLSQLALVAGVTPRQLNRLFQSTFGATTMGYYRQLRLDVARALLRSSTASIADIAAATGFASAAHFSNAFSKAFRSAPSTFRSTPETA